jgi:hypothetical protein
MAIQQMSSLSQTVGTKQQTLLGISAPPESKLEQYIRVFTEYASHHPALLHERAAKIAIFALREAFPCQ